MRTTLGIVRIFGTLIGGVTAVFATGCGGISDCRDDAEKCAQMLLDNAEPCGLAFQLRQGDEKRKHCEHAIALVGDKRVKSSVPAILKILAMPESSTPDDKHRQEAAKTLAKIGEQSAVEPLMAALDVSAGTSGDPRDKAANQSNEDIATALGELGDKRAAPRLIELVNKSRHNYAILKGVRALGLLRDPSSVDPLVKIALEHENKFMRKTAVMALGDIGDPKATDALVQMMFIEYQGVSFYREASFALYQIGPQVTDALLSTMEGKNEKVNQYFEKTGGLKDTAIKAKCGFVLGDFRDPRAVKPLMDAYNNSLKENDPVVQVNAAAALGVLGDRAAVPLLKEHMLDLDASKREMILRALNQIGDRSVVPEIIKGMGASYFAETCVKTGLGTKEQCEAEENKPSLQAAQKAAIDQASNLAGPEHVEAFKAAVEAEKDPTIKEYATKRIARLDAAAECRDVAACWLAKLKSEDAFLREKAAWELGRLKDPSTISALADALGDANTYARSAAILSYFSYGDKSAIPAIERRLEDEAGSATFVRVNEDLRRLLVYLRRKG